MAGPPDLRTTLDLADVDPSCRVSGAYPVWDGAKFIGGAGGVSQAALEAVAADLAAEIQDRIDADTALASALAGKAPLVHTHAAADVTSGVFAPARLGSGTADATTILFGNSTWGAVPAGYSDAQADARIAAAVGVTVAAQVHTHAIANVTGLQAALDLKAPLASPALTGTPTAPTATGGTSTTQLATTAFVQSAVGSFSALPVVDTTAIAKGSSDATKQVRLEVDGLTTGTTRALTVPDASGTLALIDLAQSWTALQTFGSGVAFSTSGNIAFSSAGRGIFFGTGGTSFSTSQYIVGQSTGTIELSVVGSASSLLVSQNSNAATAPGIDVRLFSAATVSTTVYTVLRSKALPNGAPAAGFGSQVLFQAGSTTTNYRDVAAVKGVWATPTDASRKGRLVLSVFDTAERTAAQFETDGTQALVALGGGSQFKSILSAAAALDFPSIAAGGQAESTISVTGAAVGDTVHLGTPAGLESGLAVTARVTAADTVTVRAVNVTGSAIDPASGTYRAVVVKF